MEILKGFVWDLQRFATGSTAGYKISVFSSAEGYNATNANLLVWDDTLNGNGGYKWIASNTFAQATQVKIGTGSGNTLSEFTLDEGMTEIIADAAWPTVTIKEGTSTAQPAQAISTVFKYDGTSVTHSFSVADTNSTVKISKYGSTTGYTLSDITADKVTLTAGKFTIEEAKKVLVTKGTLDVTVNGNTFTAGTENEYTWANGGGTIKLANGGAVTKSADSTVTTVQTNNGPSFTTVAKTVATFLDASDGITNFTDGTIKKEATTGDFKWQKAATAAPDDDIEFKGFTGLLTADKTTTVPSFSMDAGTVDTGDNIKSVTINNNKYTMSAAAKFGVSTNGEERIDKGAFTITSTIPGRGTQEIVGAKDTAYDNRLSAAKATSGDVEVTIEDGKVKSITGLGAGESVEVYGATNDTLLYTLSADANGEVVTYTQGNTQTFYQLKNGEMTSAVWTPNNMGQDKITDGVNAAAILTKVTATAIRVAGYTSETWFKSTGEAFSKKPSTYAAHLTVSGSGNNITRNLDVSSDVTVPVVIDNVNTKVVDSSAAGATYQIKSGTGYAHIKGAAFTVSSESVISDTNGGTITLLADGAVKELKLSGTVNVNTDAVTGADANPAAVAGTKLLTYVAGGTVDGAKITLNNNNSPIVLTESTNGTDTVINQTGNITGLDAGGVVKNLATDNTVVTAGSETSANVYTINGVEWTVTGDAETTFTVKTDNATQLSTIANLDLDATVATTKKFSQDELTVNGTTFYKVVSKDGLTFTSTQKNSAASVELNAAGESVTRTSATGTQYTVVSTSDGVTIGADGKISGLTNGDVVTVHNVGAGDGKSVITLTVSEGKLVVSTVKPDGTPVAGDTTYTLDSGETSFTAALTATGTYATTDNNTVVVSNGSAAESVTGFSVGTGSNAEAEKKAVTSVANSTYLDKDGKTLADNSSGKAVAQIQLENDRITYTEIGDKAQAITVNNDSHEWNITTNAGKDVISYTSAENATINSGAGNDKVTATSNGDLYINLGAGKDTVSVGGKGDHTIVAGEGNSEITVTATGDVRVDATGAGNKQIKHTGAGVATLYGGDGNDTIKAYSTDDSVVGGAGNNVFDVTTTGMKVSDYNVTKDVVSVTVASASTNLAASQFLGDGTVSLSAAKDHVLDVSDGTGVSGYYAIAAEGTDGKKQLFGWAQDSGSNIDVSNVTESVILIGNNNDDKADTLMGGTKNDTIYAGEGDAVYGGAGKDRLVLDGTKGGQTVYTATTAGKDTVTGFTAGFEDGDKINFVDGTASDVTFDYTNKTVTVKDGDGSLTITNLDTVASGAVELFAANTKVALTGANGIIKTDSVSYADVYVGDGSAVDFSSVEGGLHVNLANGIAGDTNLARFSGITSVKGGTGATTLMGAASAESLVSGGGNTSLWGGAGKDTLVGGDGKDMFFIGAGDGTDTMTKFTGGTDATSDTIFFLSGITGAKLGTTGVEVTTTDAKAVLSGTNANTAIHYAMDGAEGVAKVGSATANNSFKYDSTVTYYGGGSKSDKIEFTSGSTENAEIWLDGSHGKAYASIDVVDGTNTSGNLIVAGDSSSQSIIGGKGDTSIWGGAGNATDTLRSSSGSKTMFWWGAGEGNDLVVSTSADDSVNLYNLKLSDVDVANSSITNSGVSLALNDGNKLTVQTGRDMTFSIDGQSWTAQHNSKTWKQNS